MNTAELQISYMTEKSLIHSCKSHTRSTGISTRSFVYAKNEAIHFSSPVLRLVSVINACAMLTQFQEKKTQKTNGRINEVMNTTTLDGSMQTC